MANQLPTPNRWMPNPPYQLRRRRWNLCHPCKRTKTPLVHWLHIIWSIYVSVMWFKYLSLDNYLFNNKDCFLHSLMVLERRCQNLMRKRTEPSNMLIWSVWLCTMIFLYLCSETRDVICPGAVEWHPRHGTCWEASVAVTYIEMKHFFVHVTYIYFSIKNGKDGYGIEREECWTWSALQKADGSPKVILRCWCPKQACYYDRPYKPVATYPENCVFRASCLFVASPCFICPTLASDAKKDLTKLLVECTQADVACNYLLSRARSI